MKAIKKVDAMVELANNLTNDKEFDVASKVHFLGVELCGYHKAQKKVEQLELQLKNQHEIRGERKKNIDTLLADFWANNVKMIRGAGMSNCPIRAELTKVFSAEKIAEKTYKNILSAISYSLHKKRPYNIHYAAAIAAEWELLEKNLRDTYLTESIAMMQKNGIDMLKMTFSKKLVDAKQFALSDDMDDKETEKYIELHKTIQTDMLEKIASIEQVPPASEPPASEPPASEPPASEPPASEPPASEPPASEPQTKKNPRRDYMVDTLKVMQVLHDATQFRKHLNDSDKVYYENILGAISTIMDNLTTMSADKDVSKIIGDMQENDDFDDDNLDIDTTLVD